MDNSSLSALRDVSALEEGKTCAWVFVSSLKVDEDTHCSSCEDVEISKLSVLFIFESVTSLILLVLFSTN